MKFLRLIFVIYVLLTLTFMCSASLEDEFRDPPDSAKPWVYWINMDGHFTREGITADFEAMKKAGIGGMIHMDVDVGVPRGKVPFMSKTWQDNFRHAVLECERLGLKFTTITGPGWTGSGGPWIKPDQSMQHLVPISVNAKGPAKFDQVLPKPQPRVSRYHRNPPVKSPSLSGYPKCDDEVKKLTEKLWGSLSRPEKITKRKYGRGAVYWGPLKPDGLYHEYDDTASILKQMDTVGIRTPPKLFRYL
jgi:hypothetical protein